MSSNSEVNLSEVEYDFRPWRGLTHETMRQFNVLTKVIAGQPQEIMFPTVLPHAAGAVRQIATKDFKTVGDNPDGVLFGELVFPPGCSDTITITEGQLDAMSMWQCVGRPAVSVRSASSARKDCAKRFEYINSFKKIVLALDSDGPGRKAAASVAGLFDYNKVYHIAFDPRLKDANKYLEDGLETELKRLWWNATRYLPEGVISSFAAFDEAIDDLRHISPLGTWPLERLQEMLGDVRPGEITLLTAPEGIGKTEFVRMCEHHWLKTTDWNIGAIHIEENETRQLRGLAGLELGEACHLPDCQVSPDKIKASVRGLVKREDRLHLYSHFGTDDPDAILDSMRFLAGACECRLMTLDHITMLVTGLAEKDERQTLDYISTKLSRMVNDLNFHLLLVSHVNDDGQTRGSRNISKVAYNRIDLRRDLLAADEIERNTTSLMVSKARLTSLTGPAGSVYFDREKFCLLPAKEVVPDPVKITLDKVDF